MTWAAGKLVAVGVLAGGIVVGVVAAASPGAEAKAAYESPYGYDRTWNAALRMIRVDNGWKITEKDDTSGYLLFEYKSPESTRATPGSIELVRISDRDAHVSVLIQLSQMPHYHEQVLLDALASKMRREYGEPPVRRKREEPREDPVDGGGTD